MKMIFRIAALAVALAGMAMASDDPVEQWRTCSMFNGRYWQEMPGSQSGFLAGLMDTKEMDDSKTITWPDNINIGEMRKGIDRIYSDPANIRMPILYAFMLAARRFRGDPETDVNEGTAWARRYIVTCGVKPVAQKKSEVQ